MANTISNLAHLDPHALQRHNRPEKTSQGQAGAADGTGPFAKLLQQTDTVSISHETQTSATYSSSLTVQDKANDGYNLLRGLVLNMLKEQGIDFKVANGDQEYDISQLSQEEAQELIAEDGYFGVKQTSDRIVDFAISLAGNDPSRLDAIKAGIEKGFNEAKDAFGGWLPDISYQTYDAVYEKLDAWANEAGTVQESA